MNIPLNQSPSLIDQSTKTTSSCHCIDKNPSVLFGGHLEVHTKCEKTTGGHCQIPVGTW